MKKLNTTEEEAARLNVSPKTLANQRCRGNSIPFIRLGRLIRYDPDLTDEYLAKRVACSTSEVLAG